MARKRYSNTDPSAVVKSWKEVRRWQQERKGLVKDLTLKIGQAEHKQWEFLRTNRTDTTITWIGHSTFLIQMAGLTILTDPVWANRMGFARRLEAPGLTIDELPKIDVILLSHAHYDHLHIRTLLKLKEASLVIVPEGLSRKMRSIGFRNVVELPWWGKMSYGTVEFDFVPAQHWTRRTLTDTNTSLWGGWVMKGNEGESVYFAGDSGYFKGFREIGERFPDIRYALMPIGAYEPEWFMGPQHVTPEEAVQAFLDVGAENFIPMHYGAFRLADDTAQEAMERLLADWQRRELEPIRLRMLKHGETIKD